MSNTLRDFHFNPVKLGQIIKQMMNERKVSNGLMQKLTAVSRDTIENIINGRNQDIKFEQLFKICCVLEVPVAVIEMLMIKDEDIDFTDQIVYYDAANGEVLPAADVDPAQVPVSDTVVAVAEAVAAAEKPPEPTHPAPITTEYVAFLQDHIKHLTALLEISMKGGST